MPADTSSKAKQSAESLVVRVRAAVLADAPQIWRLVKDSGGLDPNSVYCYLLLCRDFAETCVVACRGAAIIGFITAYRPPAKAETVFVWQVGVAAEARGQGLAKRLLHALVALPACRGVRFLEATVTPSNTASRRLFQAFAREANAACVIGEGFRTAAFGDAGHEEEELFRIGPLASQLQEKLTT